MFESQDVVLGCDATIPAGKERDAAADGVIVSFFPVESLDDKVDTDKLSDLSLSLALSHILLDSRRWEITDAVTVPVTVEPDSAVIAGDATPF